MHRRLSSLIVALSVAAAPVGAQTFNGTSTGLGSPAQVIDFNTGAGAIGTIGGVSFSGLYYNAPYLFNGGAQSALNYLTGGFSNPVSLVFAQAVNGAAFQLITWPGISTITAYRNGSIVQQYTPTTDLSGMGTSLFYGFDNSVALDRIDISVAQRGYNDAIGIDNVEIGDLAGNRLVGNDVIATPEPASVALLATGLIGVAGVAVRRRRKA